MVAHTINPTALAAIGPPRMNCVSRRLAAER